MAPLILLLKPKGAQQHHEGLLSDAGFRVVTSAFPRDAGALLEYGPAVVAAELVAAHAPRTLDLARKFRELPLTEAIPFIIYGPHLRTYEIERTTRTGALWLHVEPRDGAKFVAAVRGVLAVAAPDRAATAT
jgi:hypothetical protein